MRRGYSVGNCTAECFKSDAPAAIWLLEVAQDGQKVDFLVLVFLDRHGVVLPCFDQESVNFINLVLFEVQGCHSERKVASVHPMTWVLLLLSTPATWRLEMLLVFVIGRLLLRAIVSQTFVLVILLSSAGLHYICVFCNLFISFSKSNIGPLISHWILLQTQKIKTKSTFKKKQRYMYI